MKKIHLLITLLGIALLSSCEGFLDVKPSNSAAAETSITNANDAKVVMNGLMRKLASSSYYGRDFILYGDAKGGDFAIYSQGRGYDGLYTFNHSVSTGNMGTYWSQMYDVVLQCNNLLLNIEKIEAAGNGSTALSQIKGQALTTRALVYFDLVRLYGKTYTMDKASYGVPLVLTPLDASAQPTRASVEEVYTQILKDLNDADPILPKTKVNGFLNYFGNLAIKARVYLTMGRYADALTAAEGVIASTLYSLYTNANWNGSWATPFASESIFELGVYAGEANLGTGSLGYYLLRRNKVTGALGWFMASDYFIARLNQDPTDIRKAIMDYDESSTTRFGACMKYVGGHGMTGDKGIAAATNIKVIRLSEVYLMAAEAALNLPTPDKVKAANYLNQIRKRAPALPAATSANVTMSMIEDERSKELFAEGHRYFDMLRWNKTIEYNDDFIFPAVVITNRTKIIDRTFYKTILPIPQNEIDANPAIAAQQNPGYVN
jgi:tetratricopeptide (TPR) repeat protein